MLLNTVLLASVLRLTWEVIRIAKSKAPALDPESDPGGGCVGPGICCNKLLNDSYVLAFLNLRSPKESPSQGNGQGSPHGRGNMRLRSQG